MNTKKYCRYFWAILFVFGYFLQPSALLANNALTDEIERIENGLLEGINIVGQPVKKHSITNRLKHYNILDFPAFTRQIFYLNSSSFS